MTYIYDPLMNNITDFFMALSFVLIVALLAAAVISINRRYGINNRDRPKRRRNV
jgi:hypothetical protein